MILSKAKNRLKEEKFNKFGSKMIITRYKICDDIDVYFPEYNWTAEHTTYDYFKKGNIRCPYEPRICDKGYFGEGKYCAIQNNETVRSYYVWRNMIIRCYDHNYKLKFPTYEDCEVCEEWLNYQNFAKWYEDNYYEIPGQRMDLDKDILIKGNKLYSPDTCIIVPHSINSLFVKNNAIRGEYPIGISLDKQKNKLRVRCYIYENGKQKLKHLGYFATNQIEEAFYLYKTTKENNIKAVANEYKNLIPEELYNAMYNYTVDFDD